jgi:hypothetical protein
MHYHFAVHLGGFIRGQNVFTHTKRSALIIVHYAASRQCHGYLKQRIRHTKILSATSMTETPCEIQTAGWCRGGGYILAAAKRRDGKRMDNPVVIVVSVCVLIFLIFFLIMLQKGDMAARVDSWLKGCFTIVVSLAALLAAIYGLVRFVRWAWYQ